MKKIAGITGLCLALSVITVFWGCEKDQTQNDADYAWVRFIHSAASTGEIDFTYLSLDDGVYLTAVSDAVYGEQYGYFALIPEVRTFRVYLPGTDISVAEATLSLSLDQHYTIVATDLEVTINPSLITVEDTTETAPEGKAFVRFMHASADAPDMEIQKADGTILATNLSRYQFSSYVEIEEGTYEFSVCSSETGGQLFLSDPLTLSSGNNFTVIISGSLGSLPGPVLNARLYQETNL